MDLEFRTNSIFSRVILAAMVCVLCVLNQAQAGLITMSMLNQDGVSVTVVMDTETQAIWWQDLTTFMKSYGGEIYDGQMADIALMSPIVGYNSWHMASVKEFESLIAAATVTTDPYLDLSDINQFVFTDDTSSTRDWEGVVDEAYDADSHYTKIVSWWKYAADEGEPGSEWYTLDDYVDDVDGFAKGAWVTAQPIPVPGAFILSCIGIGCVVRLRRRGAI